MIDDDVKAEFRKLNERLDGVEQILPPLVEDVRVLKVDVQVLKDDVRGLKEDVRGLKEDVQVLKNDVGVLKDDVRVLKDDVRGLKDDVRGLKDDLKERPTRDEMYAAIRDEGERTRRHFDVVAESLRDEIRLGFEGHLATTSRLDTLEHRHDRLDGRVSALEAAPRRRK